LIYWHILQGLEASEQNQDPRGDLDGELNVPEWATPGSEIRLSRRGVPDDAPSWWRGDQSASDEFFRGMGLDPRKARDGMGGSA
jgi:hypothetical protein